MRPPRRTITHSRSRPSDLVIGVMRRLALGIEVQPDALGAAFYEVLTHREAATRPMLIGSFLASVIARGPRAPDVVALLRAAFSLDGHDPSARMTVALPAGRRLIGVSGTGKEPSGTIHTTIASALVAASLGVHVACTGPSSPAITTGVAEVLDELGVPTDLPGPTTIRALVETGFGFFASERVVPRLEAVLGRVHAPTVLDFALQAVVCPLKTHGLVHGVSHPDVALALEVLRALGVYDAHVVTTRIDEAHLIDEIGVFGETRIARMIRGVIEAPEVFRPAELFRLPPYRVDDVGESATRTDSARRIVQALRGRGSPGVIDVVCANAANVLCAGGRAEDLRDGFEKARRAIDGDRPLQKLEEVVAHAGGSPRALRRFLGDPLSSAAE